MATGASELFAEDTKPNANVLRIAENPQIELRSVGTLKSPDLSPNVQAAKKPDAELAKRPWLLEKLVGEGAEPSVKMDPPRPPVNPPSIDQLVPPSNQSSLPPSSTPLSDAGDGWIERQKISDVPKRLAPKKSLPLDEVTVEDFLRNKPSDSKRSTKSVRVGDLPPSKDQESSPSSLGQATTDQTSKSTNDSITTSTSPSLKLDYTGFPKKPIRLTRSVYQMRSRMQQTLRSYYYDIEIANRRSNWGMMHAIMVYGIDTKIRVGRDTYNAIAWIAGNNACRGQKILDQQGGDLRVKSGVGLQGHQAQMLAVFSLCNVPADYPLYAGERKFTVSNVVELEKLDCKRGEELTFSLIGLSHYLDTDAIWTNREGEVWDFERLIQEELGQPIVGAACGGTHRLMGFAHALRKRRAEGKPITGQWKRAEDFTKEFVRYAYRLQNRDGSFSTDWFEGRENNRVLDRQIQTTGHIVEWLLTVTPDESLQNPRLVSAVRFLLDSMYKERKRDWSIGPKGHALRSLAMYYDRVYQAPPPWRQSSQMARKRQSLR